jgi:hypothetical protein
MAEFYWTIRYRIEFLSDFHAGDGTVSLGGNLHALRQDEDEMPYLPATQVRGLIRWGAHKLASWQPGLKPLLNRNFKERGRDALQAIEGRTPSWAYTRAAFPPNSSVRLNPHPVKSAMVEQSHVQVGEKGVAQRLFSFQKAGLSHLDSRWEGSITSVHPATERDVAFMIAAMRVDDRIGRRRSRGYGKVRWVLRQVQRYEGRSPLDDVPEALDHWLALLFQDGVASS